MHRPANQVAHVSACMLLAVMLGCLSGCSLFVMAGKMFYGDPVFKSAFTNMTGVDLSKEDKTVLVLCTAPQAIKRELPSLEYDLVETVVKKMKYRGIAVVPPDEVAKFIDNQGGVWTSVDDFVGEFETDYIIYIDINQYSYLEQNSQDMFRGRSRGSIHTYQVQTIGDQETASEIFVADFAAEFPEHHPVSFEQFGSPRVFQHRFADYLSEEFGRKFYSYRLGDGFN